MWSLGVNISRADDALRFIVLCLVNEPTEQPSNYGDTVD
jgi:hypothetical protein